MTSGPKYRDTMGLGSRLKRAVALDAYAWLTANAPEYLDAIEGELAEGMSPEQVGRILSRELGPDRDALAHRCRQAAEWIRHRQAEGE